MRSSLTSSSISINFNCSSESRVDSITTTSSNKMLNISLKELFLTCTRSRSRRRRSLNCRRLLLLQLLLLSLAPLASSYRPEPEEDHHHQAKGMRREEMLQAQQTESRPMISARILQDKVKFNPKPDPAKNSDKSRRDLSGLGSSPPQCNSKCGYCSPCRAVHVPIQPGFVRTTEYYPEAWRCKCGNKLYMP